MLLLLLLLVLQKLDEFLRSDDKRWRERGHGFNGEAVVEIPRDTSGSLGGECLTGARGFPFASGTRFVWRRWGGGEGWRGQ